MANTTNNTNTYTGTENLSLIAKAAFATTWNGLGSGMDLTAGWLRTKELGRAAEDTTFFDIAMQRGRFIEELNVMVKTKTDELLASMTYSNGKLTEDEIKLAQDTLDAIIGLKDEEKSKALKQIKVGIWNAKRVAAESGDKAAKLALRTSTEKAIDDAMAAWLVANPAA